MGNTVVLKPAEQTPLTALRLAELAPKPGMPPGVLQRRHRTGRVDRRGPGRHPLVRKIAFTGSTEVGSEVMRLAADDIKRVCLELGGKSANLIFDDATLEPRRRLGLSARFGNAGQDCCARSRILVERSIYDRFVDRCIEPLGPRRSGLRSAGRSDRDGIR